MTATQPSLETRRAILRPLTIADAPTLKELAGDRRVAATTGMIPHPYPDGAAEEFIRLVTDGWADGRAAVFAIVPSHVGTVIGCCGLHPETDHGRAELGYWIGVPWWNQGWATEAAAAVVGWGFRERDVHRIFADCFARNPASARVLDKLGFTLEGRAREHYRKWDVYEDVLRYGMLRSEWRE